MQSEPVRGNVYVAKLARGTSDEQLAELFDPYGVVLRAFVARDPVTGETLDHGLVELAPDEAVEEALAGLHGAETGVDARRADPEMTLAAPARAVARPARPTERPFSPLRASAAAASAAPRFTVERMRPPARSQATSLGAVSLPRPVPSDGAARERPTLRLSMPSRTGKLPVGSAELASAAPARG